jgi:trehalose-6-phosphate synthase
MTITRKGAEFNYAMSSGGLVSALSGLAKNIDFTWIGWTGLEFKKDEQTIIKQELKEKYKCEPVFIDDKMAEAYYNGFSNRYVKTYINGARVD